MAGHRMQFGAAVLDGKLYVVGGRNGFKTVNTVECYDPVRKSWKLMPSMATHRHGLGKQSPCTVLVCVCVQECSLLSVVQLVT